MDPTVLAYIAGFLDGDGSIFFQLIRKPDYRFGFQIRPSVAFYQKTNNETMSRFFCGSSRTSFPGPYVVAGLESATTRSLRACQVPKCGGYSES
jgi:hypothetical protein